MRKQFHEVSDEREETKAKEDERKKTRRKMKATAWREEQRIKNTKEIK